MSECSGVFLVFLLLIAYVSVCSNLLASFVACKVISHLYGKGPTLWQVFRYGLLGCAAIVLFFFVIFAVMDVWAYLGNLKC